MANFRIVFEHNLLLQRSILGKRKIELFVLIKTTTINVVGELVYKGVFWSLGKGK